MAVPAGTFTESPPCTSATLTTMRPAASLQGFLDGTLAEIGAKLKVLTGDPRPDGGTKKQLKYLNREVNRIRSGDYRVFYTFDDRYGTP